MRTRLSEAAQSREPRATFLLRKKPIAHFASGTGGLVRTFGTTDLVLLGVGAIIGAGIFVLTGVAAATLAGPAVVLSFIVAGLACAFAAVSYAELAASIGGSGSAYGYAYAGFGEIVAWLIGWDLILEYTVAVSAVAVGWSGYARDALGAIGVALPDALERSPAEGGIVNLFAVLIILMLGALLGVGVRASARFNASMVLVKLAAIGIFVVAALGHVEPANWSRFAPFGWEGVMSGAALVFFAFIGFDAVSTAAEEAIDPPRGLPAGIVGSLAICTSIYVCVAALLTLIAPYTSLDSASPVSAALTRVGADWAASAVAIGAIAGLTSVMLVLYYAQTRIFYAMSQDGLLPAAFRQVSPATHTPLKVIVLCGLVMSLLAGFLPLAAIAELVNIGTLAAFALVCSGVLVLRVRRPDLPRPFRAPFGPVIPALGVLSCLYLMLNLGLNTWLRFIAWMLVGLIVYLLYSRTHSRLAT